MDPQNSSFVSVNGLLCNADVTEIVACPAGLRSFVFPSSVTSIRSHAFSGCHYLREITIPQKVSRIGTVAFIDCKNLQIITVEVGSLI